MIQPFQRPHPHHAPHPRPDPHTPLRLPRTAIPPRVVPRARHDSSGRRSSYHRRTRQGEEWGRPFAKVRGVVVGCESCAELGWGWVGLGEFLRFLPERFWGVEANDRLIGQVSGANDAMRVFVKAGSNAEEPRRETTRRE